MKREKSRLSMQQSKMTKGFTYKRIYFPRPPPPLISLRGLIKPGYPYK